METRKHHLAESHDLYHEIFGSILDRSEIAPYLLLKTHDYESALRQTTKVMGNRGFDVQEESGELGSGESARALRYVEHAIGYCLNFIFPSLKGQLRKVEELNSSGRQAYRDCLSGIARAELILNDSHFREIIFADPRHLFLMASSIKYKHVFYGYKGENIEIPAEWQQAACSLLKTAYLIKSIEEDSQDINDYAQLSLFFINNGQDLHGLYDYDWNRPLRLPDNESAQRAYVKIATFFQKLKNYITHDSAKGCLVFNSGDGVDVDIVKIESRLKSPQSILTKLGKNVEGEVHNIRDLLALTFILKNIDDTLMLFHALQKRGVILQENTLSQTITQTLFEEPQDMASAVRNLLVSLDKSSGRQYAVDESEIMEYAKKFYGSLSFNARKNPHSAMGHNKFQCKLNVSIPIHRNAETGRIMLPGTDEYLNRQDAVKTTEQHTLALELRISDEQSWHLSEQKGDSHHDAYKFRQLLHVMNRLFSGHFQFPAEHIDQLRADQKKLFR